MWLEKDGYMGLSMALSEYARYQKLGSVESIEELRERDALKPAVQGLCPVCGQQMIEEKRFCPNCGQRIYTDIMQD